jgi:hypothetical protein
MEICHAEETDVLVLIELYQSATQVQGGQLH